jgi:hypothetical protein
MALKEELRREVWKVLKSHLVMYEQIADRVTEKALEVVEEHYSAILQQKGENDGS